MSGDGDTHRARRLGRSDRLGRRLMRRLGVSPEGDDGRTTLGSRISKRRGALGVERSARLAMGRSIARADRRPAEVEPELAKPDGMSDFAFRWMYGDGQVEGVPFSGGAALLARSADTAAKPDAPRTIEEAASDEQGRTARRLARREATEVAPKGRIVEQPGPLRLARRPAPAPSDAVADAVAPATPRSHPPAPATPPSQPTASDAVAAPPSEPVAPGAPPDPPVGASALAGTEPPPVAAPEPRAASTSRAAAVARAVTDAAPAPVATTPAADAHAPGEQAGGIGPKDLPYPAASESARPSPPTPRRGPAPAKVTLAREEITATSPPPTRARIARRSVDRTAPRAPGGRPQAPEPGGKPQAPESAVAGVPPRAEAPEAPAVDVSAAPSPPSDPPRTGLVGRLLSRLTPSRRPTEDLPATKPDVSPAPTKSPAEQDRSVPRAPREIVARSEISTPEATTASTAERPAAARAKPATDDVSAPPAASRSLSRAVGDPRATPPADPPPRSLARAEDGGTATEPPLEASASTADSPASEPATAPSDRSPPPAASSARGPSPMSSDQPRLSHEPAVSAAPAPAGRGPLRSLLRVLRREPPSAAAPTGATTTGAPVAGDPATDAAPTGRALARESVSPASTAPQPDPETGEERPIATSTRTAPAPVAVARTTSHDGPPRFPSRPGPDTAAPEGLLPAETAAASGARSGATGRSARPVVTVARTARPRVAPAPRQQVSRRSSLADDLASAGGIVQAAPEGRTSIDLPPPPAAISSTTPQTRSTLARAIDAPRVGSGRRQRESAPAQGPGDEAAPDIEEIYDKVVSRLRRELRGERERVGDVLGNLRPGRSGR